MDVAGVIVGDEVLEGHVVDANGALLATTLRNAGHRLRRIAVVPDIVEIIGREIRLAREDGCRLIVTSGGLGPTHDDVTLEGVAAGLGVPVVECVAMRDRIEGWIARATEAGVSEAVLGASWLRRMALAPEGAELLETPTGGPAFAVRDGDTAVCVLPGPPQQFAAALGEVVMPRFLDAPAPSVIEEVAHGFPESMLAQTLADVVAAHPGVGIGSYPQQGRVLLRVKGPADEVAAAARTIRETLVRLELSPDAQALKAAFARRRSVDANEPPST